MSIYVVGDVQGCDDILERLLERIQFDPAVDRMWFVGDLVNRGGQSLEVLRRIRALGDAATVVLGNHDLHLLAQWYRKPLRRQKNADLARVLAADDAESLIDWLRFRPLAHFDAAHDLLMVHAGLHPRWNLARTLRCAARVEEKLREKNPGPFLDAMYGNQPAGWNAKLKGIAKLRAIVNTLTRLRFCSPTGALSFVHKGAPGSQQPGWYPWFEVPGVMPRDTRVVFGHWSSLGRLEWNGHFAVDTGCIWGGRLTALRVRAGYHPSFVSVPGRPKSGAGRHHVRDVDNVLDPD